MNKSVLINKEVDVTSIYFKGGAHLKSYPRKIECDGTTYTFTEGLQLMVRRGHDAFKLFYMTDGRANYRLRLDLEASSWTLEQITLSS